MYLSQDRILVDTQKGSQKYYWFIMLCKGAHGDAKFRKAVLSLS
jgi:hypothetical protein